MLSNMLQQPHTTTACRTDSFMEENDSKSAGQVSPVSMPAGVSVEVSGDELEIHDDHFLSSSSVSIDSEDSDIEVVLKPPEIISLCSQDSLKSIREICYKSGEISDSSHKDLCGNEEEDSEVEVIGKSIHESQSFPSNSLNGISEVSAAQATSSASISESEDYEISHVTSRVNKQYTEDSDYHGNRKTDEAHVFDSAGDSGTHDLYLNHPIERNGVRISALVFTACISVTVGIYIGYYYGLHVEPKKVAQNGSKVSFDNEDEKAYYIVNEEPLEISSSAVRTSRVNETFKNVLDSYMKLKQDYDTLLSGFNDYKEAPVLDSLLSTKETEKQPIKDNYDGSLLLNLTRNLKKERKSAAYWRSKYVSVKSLTKEKCSVYGKAASFPSLCNCFNVLSNIIPTLNISISKPAEELADQLHYIWNQLKSCWVGKKVKPIDPINRSNIDRFRKIFIISNVVNSFNVMKNPVFTSNESLREFKNNSSHDVSGLNDIDRFPSSISHSSLINIEKKTAVEGERVGMDSNNNCLYSEVTEEVAYKANNKCLDATETPWKSVRSLYNISVTCSDTCNCKNRFQNNQTTHCYGCEDEFNGFLTFRNGMNSLKSQNMVTPMEENKKRMKRVRKKKHFLESILLPLREKWYLEKKFLQMEGIKCKRLTRKTKERLSELLNTNEKQMKDLLKRIHRLIRKKDKKVINLVKNVRFLETEVAVLKAKLINNKKAFFDAERRNKKTIYFFNQKIARMLSVNAGKLNELRIKKRKYKYSSWKRMQQGNSIEGTNYENGIRMIKVETLSKRFLHKNKKLKFVDKRLLRKNWDKKRKKIKKRKSKRKNKLFDNAFYAESSGISRSKKKYKENDKFCCKFDGCLKSRKKKLIEKVKHQESQIRYLTEKMKMYRKIERENRKLKSMTFPSKTSYINRSIRSEDTNYKVTKPSNDILQPTQTPCYDQGCKRNIFSLADTLKNNEENEPHKPFVNLDISAPNLSRLPKILRSPSDAILPQLFSSPAIQSSQKLALQNKFFELPAFNEEGIGLSLNETGISESESIPYSWYVYWGKGRMEFNEHTLRHEDVALPINWYIQWMRQKEKDRRLFSLNNYPSEERTNWFVKLMKERERLRTKMD